MKLLEKVALSFLNEPYRWGGSNPMTGFDCSGLVQEILASVGMDPPGDQSARDLFQYFRQPENHIADLLKGDVPALGMLLFYGPTQSQIIHTAFALNATRMIEAGGGGRGVVNVDEAELRNSFIKIRPIRMTNIQGGFLPQYLNVEL